MVRDVKVKPLVPSLPCMTEWVLHKTFVRQPKEDRMMSAPTSYHQLRSGPVTDRYASIEILPCRQLFSFRYRHLHLVIQNTAHTGPRVQFFQEIDTCLARFFRRGAGARCNRRCQGCYAEESSVHCCLLGCQKARLWPMPLRYAAPSGPV